MGNSAQKNIKDGVVGRHDKIQVNILPSAYNCEVLARHFPSLQRKWTEDHSLSWESRRPRPPSRYHELHGVGQGIRVTVGSPTLHREWEKRSFPNVDELKDFYSEWPRIGYVVITDPEKTEPSEYTRRLTALMADVFAWGIEEAPAVVEIALDTANQELARMLRMGLHLRQSNPGDLWHFNLAAKRVVQGPAKGGNAEYQNYRTYRSRLTRQLYCYRRLTRTGPIYRSELRMRAVYLRGARRRSWFTGSLRAPFDPGVEPINKCAASPTMQVLSLAPGFFYRNLDLCTFNIDEIKPLVNRHLRGTLAHYSVRGIRHLCTSKSGVAVGELDTYRKSLEWPDIHWTTPNPTVLVGYESTSSAYVRDRVPCVSNRLSQRRNFEWAARSGERRR